MIVHINGERREFPGPLTVATMLEAMGLGKAACAVEVNKAVVPKRDHPARPLAEGDRIEVVTLVGGG